MGQKWAKMVQNGLKNGSERTKMDKKWTKKWGKRGPKVGKYRPKISRDWATTKLPKNRDQTSHKSCDL